jgi:hypothetical protein
VFVLSSQGATSTLGPVECRFDNTALAARPLHSVFRTLAHTARSWIDLERQQGSFLTHSPRLLYDRQLRIAAVDRAVFERPPAQARN